MEERPVLCPMCRKLMVQQALPRSRDVYWRCAACRLELWPPDENIEKEVAKLMAPSAPRRKKGGGRRRSRFKSKKPGERYVPWYRR